MSSENPSSSLGGNTGGIRLPPISFLSAHSNTPPQLNKLPSASNLGISSFMGGSQSLGRQSLGSPLGLGHQSQAQNVPQAKVSPIPGISHQHQLINPKYGQHAMLASSPKLTQHNYQLPDEQAAKRLKIENDERIEATNSLQSLSNGGFNKEVQVPQVPVLQLQHAQGLHVPQLQYVPQAQAPLFINSDANQSIQQLPHQINEEIARHLLQSSVVVDESVVLPTDKILPKDENPRKSEVPITLNIDEINSIIEEYYPVCRYLGTIVYNPTTTWATLQILSLPGLKEEDFDKFIEIKQTYVDKLIENSNYQSKYIPMIPPLNYEYINYLIELKIPARFIESFKYNLQNNDTSRELWGGAGGIYTDDSDILCILAHLGLFSEDQSNLKLWNQKKVNLIKPLTAKDSADLDLSIEILLLPPLPQYYGFYANGMNSRSWLGNNKHDGLSIAVHNIKWETYDTYLHDKQTFKRYQGEFAQDKQLFKDQNNKRPGWSFHADYYKQLKRKFDNLEKAS